MGVKMGWIQIKMGHPLARNGAVLAPFRANGAHPSSTTYAGSCTLLCFSVMDSCSYARMRSSVRKRSKGHYHNKSPDLFTVKPGGVVHAPRILCILVIALEFCSTV